jgi:hypothetical protein
MYQLSGIEVKRTVKGEKAAVLRGETVIAWF